MSARILVVEDQPGVAAGLRAALVADRHEVEIAPDGESALEHLRTASPDLVVLDVMLPGIDGFDVLDHIRAAGNEVPVLLLTALGEEMDKVRGFRAGADGYAVKPIGVLELQARVHALLRRRSREPADRWEFGPIVVDARTRIVERDGRPVELSRREFDLLVHLLRLDGAVASRAELLREVWGYRRAVPSRTVDTHVKSLRAKLGDDGAAPRWLVTVRRVGYRIDTEG